MLPQKSWKDQAVARLAGSVILCVFVGWVVVPFARFGDPNVRTLPFIAAAAGAFVTMGVALALMSRPWQRESFVRNFLLVLVCTYVGLTLFMVMIYLRRGEMSAPVNSIARAVIAILSFQGMALVLLRRFLREHQVTWADAFGFRTNWKAALALGALAAVAALAVTFTMQMGIQRVLQYLGKEQQEQVAVQVLRLAEQWQDQLVLGIATILLVPVAEEMLFRGVLYPFIKGAGYPRLAVWSTSLFFAAIHGNIGILLPLTFLSLVLIGVYEMTGNLLASITTHSLFNAINFTMLFAQQKYPALFHRIGLT